MATHWILCDVCGEMVEACPQDDECLHDDDHYDGTAHPDCADEALAVED